jgi:hypothetical protein
MVLSKVKSHLVLEEYNGIEEFFCVLDIDKGPGGIPIYKRQCSGQRASL